jgi:hypothetical protein
MRFLSILIFVLVSSTSIAQKEAFSWIWGYCDSTENSCTGLNGTAIMRFNNDSIASIDTVSFPAPFSRFSTSISDSAGNFLMAFNQKYLFDKNGNVLLEYDTSNYGSIWFARQSALFFKFKDTTNIYTLLTEDVEIFDGPITQPLLNNRTKAILITRIKVDSTGYEIISIDTLLRNDSLQGGCYHACRHANGRDWWIFKSTFNQKQFLRGLLTPHSFDFVIYDSPAQSMFQKGGRNQFSSDGTKFFHYIELDTRKMQIYDFDRCTGELSNFREIDFSPFIPFPPYDFTPFVLSPDASKIYMGRSNPGEEYSYQNIQIDVASQQMTLVADSVFVPMLTPNNKWVVSGYQEIPWTPLDKLNVFTQPNNTGNNIGRIKDLYNLPLGGFFVEQPEWANHLLGPIDGTICDSLGLNDETGIKKIETFNFILFPNPGTNELNFKTDLPLPVKLIIRDSQGKLVFENVFLNRAFIVSDELEMLKSGIYYVELQNEKTQTRLSRKWMKID